MMYDNPNGVFRSRRDAIKAVVNRVQVVFWISGRDDT